MPSKSPLGFHSWRLEQSGHPLGNSTRQRQRSISEASQRPQDHSLYSLTRLAFQRGGQRCMVVRTPRTGSKTRACCRNSLIGFESHFERPLAPRRCLFPMAHRSIKRAGKPVVESSPAAHVPMGHLLLPLATHWRPVRRGANPQPLLTPCHRVLGTTGLGGFHGTLKRGTALALKATLLSIEAQLHH